MAANGERFLVQAFPRNMGAGVRFVAQCARIGRGVSVALSDFAIIDLPVYELEEGGALLVVGRGTTVYCSSHCLCGGATLNILRNRRM